MVIATSSTSENMKPENQIDSDSEKDSITENDNSDGISAVAADACKK